MYTVKIRTRRYQDPVTHKTQFGRIRMITARTRAHILDETGKLVATGHSYCSVADRFNLNKAVGSAVRRAIAPLAVDRDERSRLFKQALADSQPRVEREQ